MVSVWTDNRVRSLTSKRWMISIIDSVTSLIQGIEALPAIFDANRMVFLNICAREELGGGVSVFVDVVVAGGTSTGIDAGWDVIVGVGAFCLRNLLNIAPSELV